MVDNWGGGSICIYMYIHVYIHVCVHLNATWTLWRKFLLADLCLLKPWVWPQLAGTSGFWPPARRIPSEYLAGTCKTMFEGLYKSEVQFEGSL